jgi:hypothetical protein
MSSGQQLLIVHVPNQPFERRSSAVAFCNQVLAHVQQQLSACQGGESNGIVYGVDRGSLEPADRRMVLHASNNPAVTSAEWFSQPGAVVMGEQS